jgi:hypothetical protein
VIDIDLRVTSLRVIRLYITRIIDATLLFVAASIRALVFAFAHVAGH